MNTAQVQSLVRAVLVAVGASLVASGKLTDGSLQEIAGAVSVLVSVVWSLVTHKTKSDNPESPTP